MSPISDCSKREILLKESRNKPQTFYLLDKLIFSNPWSKKIWKSSLEQNNSQHYMILYQKKIAGFLSLSLIRSERSIELHKIGILKSFRKKGIAELSLSGLHDQLRSMGVVQILLEVSDQNQAALGLYKKCGYEVYHRRKQYYADRSNALCMRKAL